MGEEFFDDIMESPDFEDFSSFYSDNRKKYKSDDWEKRKNMVKSMIPLAKAEGFVAEIVEEQLATIYPEAVLMVVERYCPIGPDFVPVADALVKVLDEAINHYRYGTETEQPEYFLAWVANQVAIYEMDRIKNNQIYWNPKELSRGTRALLSRLNVFEKRILWYISGNKDIDNDMDIDEKADILCEMPEFNGMEDYVLPILKALNRIIGDCAYDELSKTRDDAELKDFVKGV